MPALAATDAAAPPAAAARCCINAGCADVGGAPMVEEVGGVCGDTTATGGPPLGVGTLMLGGPKEAPGGCSGGGWDATHVLLLNKAAAAPLAPSAG